MATTPLTPTTLTLNGSAAGTLSNGANLASFLESGTNAPANTVNNIVATSATDGYVVSGVRPGDRMIFRMVSIGDAADTFTFKAGDYPPSTRQGLGDLVVTPGATKDCFLCVEVSRFLKKDGTIVVIPSDTDIYLTALILPRDG